MPCPMSMAGSRGADASSRAHVIRVTSPEDSSGDSGDGGRGELGRSRTWNQTDPASGGAQTLTRVHTSSSGGRMKYVRLHTKQRGSIGHRKKEDSTSRLAPTKSFLLWNDTHERTWHQVARSTVSRDYPQEDDAAVAAGSLKKPSAGSGPRLQRSLTRVSVRSETKSPISTSKTSSHAAKSPTSRSPAGKSKSPTGTSKSPTGARKSPTGTRKSPTGTSKSPTGKSKSPTGASKSLSSSIKSPTGTTKYLSTRKKEKVEQLSSAVLLGLRPKHQGMRAKADKLSSILVDLPLEDEDKLDEGEDAELLRTKSLKRTKSMKRAVTPTTLNPTSPGSASVLPRTHTFRVRAPMRDTDVLLSCQGARAPYKAVLQPQGAADVDRRADAGAPEGELLRQTTEPIARRRPRSVGRSHSKGRSRVRGSSLVRGEPAEQVKEGERGSSKALGGKREKRDKSLSAAVQGRTNATKAKSPREQATLQRSVTATSQHHRTKSPTPKLTLEKSKTVSRSRQRPAVGDLASFTHSKDATGTPSRKHRETGVDEGHVAADGSTMPRAPSRGGKSKNSTNNKAIQEQRQKLSSSHGQANVAVPGTRFTLKHPAANEGEGSSSAHYLMQLPGTYGQQRTATLAGSQQLGNLWAQRAVPLQHPLQPWDAPGAPFTCNPTNPNGSCQNGLHPMALLNPSGGPAHQGWHGQEQLMLYPGQASAEQRRAYEVGQWPRQNSAGTVAASVWDIPARHGFSTNLQEQQHEEERWQQQQQQPVLLRNFSDTQPIPSPMTVGSQQTEAESWNRLSNAQSMGATPAPYQQQYVNSSTPGPGATYHRRAYSEEVQSRKEQVELSGFGASARVTVQVKAQGQGHELAPSLNRGVMDAEEEDCTLTAYPVDESAHGTASVAVPSSMAFPRENTFTH